MSTCPDPHQNVTEAKQGAPGRVILVGVARLIWGSGRCTGRTGTKPGVVEPDRLGGGLRV